MKQNCRWLCPVLLRRMDHIPRAEYVFRYSVVMVCILCSFLPLKMPKRQSVSIHRTARIPNELFNQVIRCIKADIVRKPPRIELCDRDARESGN